MGELIKYAIFSKTQSWYESGTNNEIYITMYGTKGNTGEFVFEGSHKTGGEDLYVYEYEDIGVIERIKLDLENKNLLDDWTPQYIRILRDTDKNDGESADGYSEFSFPNKKDLGFSPQIFEASYTKPQRIIVKAHGEPVDITERITQVQFDHNPGQVSQTVMKYKETWTNINRIMISTEDRETVGIEANITYESPEFKAGKFSVALGASWERQLAMINEEETQKINQREFDWSFEADPKSYVFRLQVFLVPYTDQIYKGSDGRSRAIRKLRSEVIPAHLGDFLFIPRMDDGKIDPILMSELENDWLVHMEPDNVHWIRERHLDMWLTKGWVVYDNQIPVEPIEQAAIVVTDALHIRENHDPNAKILGYLKENDEVTVLDTWQEGSNIWVRLKASNQVAAKEQWSAMLIGKNRYIKLIDQFANFPE